MDGGHNWSEPSVFWKLPASSREKLKERRAFHGLLLSHCVASPLQFYDLGAWDESAIIKPSLQQQCRKKTDNSQITVGRENRLFFSFFAWKQVISMTVSFLASHQNWTNVSFVSFVSGFVSWICLHLTDPNMSCRYAFIFIKARLDIIFL